MLRLLFIVFVTTLLGCGRGGAINRGVNVPQQEGDWFCEMAENAEDWACIQDPELARSPRHRHPLPPKSAVSDEQSTSAPPLAEQLPQPQSEAAAVPDRVDFESAQASAPEPDAKPPRTDVPKYIRLAYQPEQPTPISNMPADFYAVQLLAMSKRDQLEAYIEEHQLIGVNAARIEREGELFFVLILGIYETHELAVRASQDLPAPLDVLQPWIRELGTLQLAMIRANAITGDAAL